MDFEAFRKKKKEAEDAQKAAAAANNRPMADGSENTWKDGLGPAGGVSNPKVKGFVLGRYSKKRVDPRELHKPQGFESMSKRTAATISRRVKCCNENVEPSTAIVICHACKTLYHPQCLMDASEGVCCPGKAVLLAPPPRVRSDRAIAEEKSNAGIERPKGITKY